MALKGQVNISGDVGRFVSSPKGACVQQKSLDGPSRMLKQGNQAITVEWVSFSKASMSYIWMKLHSQLKLHQGPHTGRRVLYEPQVGWECTHGNAADLLVP